jgi:hypothetical protein
LDFLGFPGFSRPNLDFSIGYEGKAQKLFSRGFSLAAAPGGPGACGRGHAKAQDCSSGKPSSVSDFLQEISARVFP